VRLFRTISTAILITSVCLPLANGTVNAIEPPLKRSLVGSPVFPFGENGLCTQNCPSIGSRAVVNYLSISVRGQNAASMARASLNAGDTISILYLGLDNGGYSNWWDAKATLISDGTGARADLGKGYKDDGNDFKAIKVSCDRDFNKCSPSMSWQNIRIDPSFPPGSYSLEVEFTPFSGSGLAVVAHLFGPAVLTVNGIAPASTTIVVPQNTLPLKKGIEGRSCSKLGQIRVAQGLKYACVKSGAKKLWKKMA
jgi:hypothetical protein